MSPTKLLLWDFPGGPVVRLRVLHSGDLGSIPGQGARSHMHAATSSSHAATKKSTCHN